MIKIIKEDRDPKDNIAWDIFDYLKDRLENEVESNLVQQIASSLKQYQDYDPPEELSDEHYNKLEKARREYIKVLIDGVLER